MSAELAEVGASPVALSTKRLARDRAIAAVLRSAYRRLYETCEFSGLAELRARAEKLYGDGHDPDGKSQSFEESFRVAPDPVVEALMRKRGFTQDIPPLPSKEQSVAATFRSRTNGYAYFAKSSVEHSPIKIGESGWPERRVRELHWVDEDRVSHRVSLICKVPGGWLRERALHRRFAKWRFEREWFLPGDELVEHIRELGGCYG